MEAYVNKIKSEGITLNGEDAGFLVLFLTARLSMFGQAAMDLYVKFPSARTTNKNEVTADDILTLLRKLETLIEKRKKGGRPLFAKPAEQTYFSVASQHEAYLHAVRRVLPGWDAAVVEGARARKDGGSETAGAGTAASETAQTEQSAPPPLASASTDR